MENKTIDTTKHAYDFGVNIEIPGTLFLSLLKIMDKLAKEQVSAQYKIDVRSLNHTASPENLMQVISPEGITYFNILGDMEMLHEKNIQEGKTIPQEEFTEKLKKKIEGEIEASQKLAKQPKVAKTVQLGSRNNKKKK